LTPHVRYVGGSDHHFPFMLAVRTYRFRVTAANSGRSRFFRHGRPRLLSFLLRALHESFFDWTALKTQRFHGEDKMPGDCVTI